MEKENMFPDGMRQNTDLSCSFFHPSWESSMDQSDPFESALSSMVSSPTASNNANANGESFVVRELIGRLGSICNSGEISPHQPFSAYSTPLSSPPKLHLENQHVRGNLQIPVPSLTSLAPFSTDPGFVERAARYSCFANSTLNEMGPKLDSGNRRLNISGSKPKAVQESRGGALRDNVEFGDSRENSSVSEQISPAGETGLNSRKRKSIPKGKGKETTPPAKDANENAESDAKRSKSEDGSGGKPSKDNSNQKQSEDNSKLSEPPKDYIHVRARRGQATDAHSLAERVRREKISERMKVLQGLVPGCNKVTGKAVMLDEIINYVQSLQQQVEFLSMKLATVNPRMDFDMEAAVISKDLFQSRGSLPHNVGYPFQPQPNLHTVIPSGIQAPFPASNGLGRNHTLQLPPVDTTSHVSTFWEEDLHSFVQMGFGQNQTQNCPGTVPTPQIKFEP